jgi:hypothetical protein
MTQLCTEMSLLLALHGWSSDFSARQTLLQVQALPLPAVLCGKSVHLSEPQFLHLQSETYRPYWQDITDQ